MEPKQLSNLIERVLRDIDDKFYCRTINYLLMLTSATESGLGHWIKQTKGPARGIFQIEPHTEYLTWLWTIKNNHKLFNALKCYSSCELFGGYDLEANIPYQIVLARANYYSWPESLPEINNPINGNDIIKLAMYWKKYWNTDKGKGTIEKAVADYKKYVEDL